MDQASVHATLVSQSEAAFHRGHKYFERTDGWEEFAVEGNRTYHVIITEDDYTAKYSAHISKTPQQVLQYLRQNRVAVFERHSEVHVRSSFLYQFDDNSFLADDVINAPGLGEFSIFKYVKPRIDGNTIWLVGTSPSGDAWPRGPIWHDFELVKFEPEEGGTRATCCFRGEMAFPLSEELKRSYVPKGKKYYFGIADEIDSAAL
jgi:hypothetical protein